MGGGGEECRRLTPMNLPSRLEGGGGLENPLNLSALYFLSG